MIHIEGSLTMVASFVNTPSKPSGGEIWVSNDEGLTWNEMVNFESSLETESLSAIRVSASQGILYSLASGFGINDIEVRICTPVGVECDFIVVAGVQPILDEAQGETNSVILADTNHLGTFYLGGDASEYRLQRCIVTDFDTGIAACEKLIGSGTVDGSAPHADSRCMVFDAEGDLLEGDDGGIWKRTQPSSNTGKWLTLSSSLRAVECHSSAYDPESGLIVCGAQDNGVSMGRKHEVWSTIVAGDGGTIRLDSRSSPSQLYASSQNFGFEYECNNDGSCHCIDRSWSRLRIYSLGLYPYESQSAARGVIYEPIKKLCMQERGFPFFTKFDINQQTPLPTVTMVLLGSRGIYEIVGNTATKLADISNPEGVGDLVLGGMENGMKNPYVIWVAAGDQGVWFRKTAGLLSKTSLLTPSYRPALSIDQDPMDSSRAYVLMEIKLLRCLIQIGRTINWGSTFMDITGDINEVHLRERLTSENCFQTLSVVRSIRGTNILVIGGISGLYYAEDMGDTASLSWSKMSFFPSVVVTETRVDNVRDFLLVSTLGRGVWRIDSISYLLPFLYNNTVPSTTPMFSPTTSATESASVSITARASESTSVSSLVSPTLSESITIIPSPVLESPTLSESASRSTLESMTLSPVESPTSSTSNIPSPESTPSKTAKPSDAATRTSIKKTHSAPSVKLSTVTSFAITETPSKNSSSPNHFPFIYLLIGLGTLLGLIFIVVLLAIFIVKRRQYQLLNKGNYQQSALEDLETESI